MGIMGIMRIMRLCDWCADCNNHPSGKSSPEPYQTAVQQTLGVYRGAPTCQTGQTGQTGQTQAPRPRNTHTAVAIKLPCIPQRQIFTRAIPDCGKQTHGVSHDAPVLSIWSIRSTWSISKRHANATRIPPLPSKKPGITLGDFLLKF